MSAISNIGNTAGFSPIYKLELALRVNPKESEPISNVASSAASPSSDVSKGIQKIYDAVESDPVFAKQMADLYAHTPDRETFGLADCPPLNDVAAWKAFNEKTDVFNSVASDVTAKRTDIFNSMKAENAKDADIFKAIMAFNKTLPMDYQLKAGLAKYDLYA